ncbi:hypothetical protein SBY92_002182 [Candida maltosa Xu316]
MSDRNTIGIGYYDPFGVYPVIKDDVTKIFPLQNLHVRFQASQPLKTINNLPVQMVEEIPNNKADLQQSGNIYSRIMFIKIESIDKYRSQVRPLIREWLKNIVFKYKNTWSIVLFVPADAKDKHSTIIKTSHYDKLLKDFGKEGKELSTILPGNVATNETENCFKWKQSGFAGSEVAAMFKTLVSSSFSQRYHFFMDLLKQRKHNTIERFVAHYSLTKLFDDMRLFVDALINYDDLVTELHLITKNQPQLFDSKMSLPTSFESLNFEKFIDEPKVESNLFSCENINLFDLKCFLFLNQACTLERYADSANSISIGASQISKLYRDLTLFLNDIGQTTTSDVKEFEFSVIQYYLNIPIIGKLIEQAGKSEEDNSYQLKSLLESRAELKLLQRSILGKLAPHHGIQVKGLEEVFEDLPLNNSDDDDEEISTSTTNPVLVQAMANKLAYLEFFVRLTEDIMEDFLVCERSKTIDVLSIDLAILNYERGNYSECYEILRDSHEFFIQSGWTFLGGILLEIYHECVERIDPKDDDEIIAVCLKMMAILVDNQIDINSFRLIKRKQHVEKMVAKIHEYSCKQKLKVESSLDDFFATELIPFINADETTSQDVYTIRFKIKNKFGIPFVFEKVELILVNQEGSEMEFVAQNVEITDAKDSVITLATRKFMIGSFSAYRLSISLNEKMSLVLDYGKKESQMNNASFVSDTVIEYNTSKERMLMSSTETILAYQNPEKFTAEFNCAAIVKLGTTEAVLNMVNGDNDATDIRIKVFSTTEGLTIPRENEFHIDKLDRKEHRDILIGYSYFSDKKIINMRAKIEYVVDGQDYVFQMSYDIDTTLTISVTVQDLFKEAFIYSKFQIGTANPRLPIRILATDLSTANHKIVSPRHRPTDMVAFGDQPANFFYKIMPVGNISSKDVLNLKVDYTNLHDEVVRYVSDEIMDALSKEKLLRYWYLLQDVVLTKAKYDLNNYAVNNFIRFINGAELSLLSEKIILQYVELHEDQKVLFNVMKKVLMAERLDVVRQVERSVHSLHISVAVPVLKYLQVVEYEYDKKQYVVGEPIHAKLSIKTVTKWVGDQDDDMPLAASSPGKNNQEGNKPIKDKFQLNILHDENWLMSGFKRFTFEVDEEPSTELTLIPLTVGKITLPKVIVQNMTSDEDDSEIDFVNGSETVLVIPEVNTITFSF